MKDKGMFIQIVNGNFDKEQFLDVLSIIFKETEENFDKDRNVSAFYRGISIEVEPYYEIVSVVLMSRFMKLGALKDVFDNVLYFAPKACIDKFKPGYLKMYAFTSNDNVYEYRIDISDSNYSIKFKGIDKDYKERMIKSEEKCSNIK